MKNLALVLAIVCFAIAILYLLGIITWFADPAHKYHVSHFILFGVLGVLCLVWMRFVSRSSVA